MLYKILILFNLIPCFYYSQMKVERELRQLDTTDMFVITRYPSYGIVMSYNLSTKEHIYVSILSDSISPNTRTLVIYCYLPIEINTQNIKLLITFSDGETYYYPLLKIGKNGYMEFIVNTDNLVPLYSKNVLYFTFKGIGTYYNPKGDFFIRFLKAINK